MKKGFRKWGIALLFGLMVVFCTALSASAATKYTITFQNNFKGKASTNKKGGGDVIKVSKGGSYKAPAFKIHYKGYKFAYWKRIGDGKGPKKLKPGDEVKKVSGSARYDAHFKQDQTIIYFVDATREGTDTFINRKPSDAYRTGKVVKAIYLNKNASLQTSQIPAPPKHAGYSFSSHKNEQWTNIKTSTPYKDIQTIIAVARYTPNTYKIKFEKNPLEVGTVSGSMKTQKVVYGKETALASNQFTSDTYKFTGWLCKDTGKIYSDGATIKNLAEKGTVTLYAQWQKKAVTTSMLTIKPNGGVYAGKYTNDTTSKPFPVNTKFSLSAPTRDGYKFAGWTHSGGGTLKKSGSSYTFVYGKTNGSVLAKWTKIDKSYLVIDPNGGKYGNRTTAFTTEAQPSGTKITLETPTRAGYKFSGWTLTGGGSLNSTKTVYTYAAKDGKLTAKWTSNTATLTIDPNGGVYAGKYTSAITTKAFAEGTKFNPSEPTRTGYKFNGWVLTGGGSMNNIGTTYIFGNKDGKITAQWKQDVTSVLTVDPNGGIYAGKYTSAVTTKPFVTGTKFQPSTPIREGYKFLGWKHTGGGSMNSIGTEFTFGASAGKITATWQKVS